MITPQESYYQRPSKLKVFVGGLPQNWDLDHVAELMQSFGTVINVEIKRDESGFSKGYGFAYLENHLPTKEIYGRHQYYNSVIEIKELKQRYIFILLNGGKRVSEQEIGEALVEQGHNVEMVEIGSRSYKHSSTFAKVTFGKEASAKWFLNKKSVEIGNNVYNVSATFEAYKSRQAPSKLKDQKGKPYGRKNDYNIYPTKENFYVQEVEEDYPQLTATGIISPINYQSESETPEVSKVSDIKAKSKPNSTQSSDDRNSNQEDKVETTKTKRKLSYRGKDVAFHPTLPIGMIDLASATDTEASMRPQSNHLKTADQKEISVISQSKLSSASRDWGIENLLMWSDPLLAANLLLPQYTTQENQTFFPRGSSKSHEWSAVNSNQLDRPKKKEIWIEFFTYPGCA